MFDIGDRVRHRTESDTFGLGTIIADDEKPGTALVEWDSHEVTRESDRLSRQQSHVQLKSLVKAS